MIGIIHIFIMKRWMLMSLIGPESTFTHMIQPNLYLCLFTLSAYFCPTSCPSEIRAKSLCLWENFLGCWIEWHTITTRFTTCPHLHFQGCPHPANAHHLQWNSFKPLNDSEKQGSDSICPHLLMTQFQRDQHDSWSH